MTERPAREETEAVSVNRVGEGPEAPPMRLFVAVPAPPEVEARALEAIRMLRGRGDVRWTTPDHLHLTLKFLGETPAARLPTIRQALGKTANNFSRFVVELEGVGAFPHVRHPRVIWLGADGTEALPALAREIDRALHSLGFPLEKRAFQPHLTLGRVRSARGMRELGEALHQIARLVPPRTEWAVDEFHLIRSELGPGGSRYTLLDRFPLRPGGATRARTTG